MTYHEFIRSTALAWSVVLGSAITASATQSSNWIEHRNERYGFSLQYPTDVFKVERTAEAGDGQVFTNKDGDAKLLVGTLLNEQRYTPATYQAYIAQRSYGQYRIEYKPLGKTWFVLSGETDGKMFYEKVMFSCEGRLINSFAMIYPTDQRSTFDPIVEQIQATFRPGNACQAVGIAPKQPERRPHSATAAPRSNRSALADRIARTQGRDVIVVLRRTSPPYDRKIVRGYVSRAERD